MKTVQDYLSLPYTMIVRRDDRDSIYVARVKEIPGCSAHGDTPEAALEMLHDNLEDWIADCLERGDFIPLPEDDQALPSGKWVQRVPRSLHKRLSERADAEGISLNQLVVSYLSEAIAKPDANPRQDDSTVIPALYGDFGRTQIPLYANYQYSSMSHADVKPVNFLTVLDSAWSKNLPMDRSITIKPKREEVNYGYQESETIFH